MSKLRSANIPDQNKVAAKEILDEAIDEMPDSAIVLLFWKDSGQFKIKCSRIPDRLMLLGALEEAKNHVIMNGYAV